jgi:hypothetical protein
MKKEKLKIIQEKIKGCEDSLFYDGDIARMGKYLLKADGDIEIYEKRTGETVFARGKRYADKITIMNDKELKEVITNSDYEIEMNNWFEVVDSKSGESILGDVAYDYDEGIELLKLYHEERIYG